ncbi:hypothetical protein DFH09DRAFT_1105999 [Mycena vulgaris]|nr:hypothetical protein DFH09DRAFT_1105999 [Mycena vulgaris]
MRCAEDRFEGVVVAMCGTTERRKTESGKGRELDLNGKAGAHCLRFHIIGDEGGSSGTRVTEETRTERREEGGSGEAQRGGKKKETQRKREEKRGGGERGRRICARVLNGAECRRASRGLGNGGHGRQFARWRGARQRSRKRGDKWKRARVSEREHAAQCVRAGASGGGGSASACAESAGGRTAPAEQTATFLERERAALSLLRSGACREQQRHGGAVAGWSSMSVVIKRILVLKLPREIPPLRLDANREAAATLHVHSETHAARLSCYMPRPGGGWIAPASDEDTTCECKRGTRSTRDQVVERPPFSSSPSDLDPPPHRDHLI